jgi:hypothetical protein
MHKFAPLLYSYMLAPTCFGSSLPSSGSFWIRLELRENTDRYGGVIMSFNLFYSTQGASHTDSYLLYILDKPPHRFVFFM